MNQKIKEEKKMVKMNTNVSDSSSFHGMWITLKFTIILCID